MHKRKKVFLSASEADALGRDPELMLLIARVKLEALTQERKGTLPGIIADFLARIWLWDF